MKEETCYYDIWSKEKISQTITMSQTNKICNLKDMDLFKNIFGHNRQIMQLK